MAVKLPSGYWQMRIIGKTERKYCRQMIKEYVRIYRTFVPSGSSLIVILHEFNKMYLVGLVHKLCEVGLIILGSIKS